MVVSRIVLVLLIFLLIVVALYNVVTIISLMNAPGYARFIQAPTSGFAPTNGEVRLCIADMPVFSPPVPAVIKAPEDEVTVFDFNVTEQNIGISFMVRPDRDFYEMNAFTGVLRIFPNNSHVDYYFLEITAIDRCKAVNSTTITFLNITNKNDLPEFQSLTIFNSTYNTTSRKIVNSSVVYNFPIVEKIKILEDQLYIFNVTAYDPDLELPAYYYYQENLTFRTNLTLGTGSIELIKINNYTAQMFFIPVQQDVGNYSAYLLVRDNNQTYPGVDIEVITLEVINVNDPPVLPDIENQMAFVRRPYRLDIIAYDEDGDYLYFDINFTKGRKIFDLQRIDSSAVMINFTPLFNESGNFTINITVNDTQAWDWVEFNLTIKDRNNTAPNITDWYPEELEIELTEGDRQDFWIKAEDPDSDPLSTRWFWDGEKIENESTFNFTLTFGLPGQHNLTVFVTDGDLNDTLNWSVIIFARPSPPPGPAPPGGGAAGPGPAQIPPCPENWRCTPWPPCPVYSVQTRDCRDLNKCGTIAKKPEDKRPCIYTPSPSCSDSLENCHDGDCEALIDCGGPCSPCPTCFDNVLNQNEKKVDCGGPCPPCSPEPTVCGNLACEGDELYTCPDDCRTVVVNWTLIIAVVILILVVLVLVVKYKDINAYIAART